MKDNPANRKKKVQLGNYHDLHTGYHGALLRNNNELLEYKTARPDILCYPTKPNRDFHPLHTPCYFEVHRYADDAEFIHSAFFPVCNKVPWIVDMDDICIPIYGRANINHSLMKDFKRDFVTNPLYRETVLCRLRGYTTPYCKGILFHCEYAMQRAKMIFERYGILDTTEVTSFLEKIVIRYPQMKPVTTRTESSAPYTILFCARSFEDKGGNIALNVFRKLRKTNPSLKLIYCGPIPPAYKESFSALLESIEYYPGLPYEESLKLLKHSDIYLLPTQFESLGITLVEAQAAASIPITYRGKELEAVEEIIESGKTGILLEKPKGQPDEILEAQRFIRSIIHLTENPSLMQHIKSNGLKEVTYGKFSLEKGAALLNRLYDRRISSDIHLQQGGSNDPVVYTADECKKMVADYIRKKRVANRIIV